MIATDQQGRVRFINPIALQQTGWSHSEAIGSSLPDVFRLVREDTREPIEILDTSDRPDAAGLEKRFAGLLLSRDGKPVVVETNITSIQGSAGKVYGRVLAFRDVTRQREILQEVRRQADRAEALVEVASRINSHLELDAVLSTICEITNRTLQATGTAVLLQHPQKPIFQNRAATSVEPALREYEGVQFEIPADVFQVMLSRSKPVYVIQDIQAYANLPYFDDYRKMDLRTLAVAALFRGSRLVGALVSVFSHHPKSLLEDEAVLIKGLADQGLQRHRECRAVRAGPCRPRAPAETDQEPGRHPGDRAQAHRPRNCTTTWARA